MKRFPLDSVNVMNRMRLGILIVFSLFLSSCTLQYASVDDFQAEPRYAVIEVPPYARDIMQAVGDRNTHVENAPQWIEQSYAGLHIRRLQDVSYSDYESYAKYTDNGAVYIIVHPAYYAFFHSKKPLIERTPENRPLSIVDLFLGNVYDTSVIRYMQEQTRNEKNFIEYLSMKGNLVILVLPRNYLQHPSYSYGSESSEHDEFARYINEISNGAESVLYMESNSPTGGKLLPQDQVMLFSFLSRVGAEKILIGGGYVGRCQGEFYNYVTTYATMGNYLIVPEISVFSPEDISEKKAELLLSAERDNSLIASSFISHRMSKRPGIQHIATWQIDSMNSRIASASSQSRPSRSSQKVSAVNDTVLPLQEDASSESRAAESLGGYY